VARRVTTRAVPPLDDVPESSTNAALSAPADACPNCWRAWLAGARNSIGYCWHGKIAWRVKSGALSIVPGGHPGRASRDVAMQGGPNACRDHSCAQYFVLPDRVPHRYATWLREVRSAKSSVSRRRVSR
jgi:hypothetical protein